MFIAISIHAPARGATNTGSPLIAIAKISIHAPARGATTPCIFLSLLQLISIHAPARGATVYSPCFVRPKFQSTLPRGERPRFSAVVGINFNISIHAPARGATSYEFQFIREHLEISIHAPARGATLIICTSDPYQFKFQSTLPRGERR